MRTIGEFELVDHGMEYPQYFQGCEVAFTGFANVVTGIGDNPAEAIIDCLFQIGQADWISPEKSMEARILEQEGWEVLPTEPSVLAKFPVDGEGEEGDGECELYYRVSIRWNEGS